MTSSKPNPEPRLRVLVIDDEKNIRATLSLCLEQADCQVTAVSSGESALDALTQQAYDLAFLDVRLGDTSGLDLIPKLIADCPNLLVVVITAYATIDNAVDAIKRGAADYLAKPFTPAQIRHVVDQCIKQRDLKRQVIDLEGRLREAAPDSDLESDSPKLRAVFEVARKAASSDAAVLLRGESGTGKSVLARWIHSLSPRSRHPFVVVNCPTLSEELLTSELFGHAKGAFTGAVRDQAGRVEAAEGGTLFLDEIGDISPSLQAKLLRFIEEKEFERLGENKTRRADVRTVAATNRDLTEHVRKGLFREDLLYRLNVIDLQLPPLRERPEDILRLARRFLLFFAKSARRQPPELSEFRCRCFDRVLMARQCPRAQKHHRKSGDPLAGSNHRTGSLSAAHFRAPSRRGRAASGRRFFLGRYRARAHHSGGRAHRNVGRSRRRAWDRRLDALAQAKKI